MKLPFDVIPAIEQRSSVRSYLQMPVEKEKMDALMGFSRKMPIPFMHTTQVKFFKSDYTNELYLVMKSPEDNMALISYIDPVSLGKAGFVGELMVLRATSLGLSSCWVAGFRKNRLLEIAPDALVGIDNPMLKDDAILDRRTVCCVPMGYYAGKSTNLYDKIAKTVISKNRGQLKDYLEVPSLEPSIPKDYITVLNMGMKAPSSNNSRPWRFSFDKDFKTIEIAPPSNQKPKKHGYLNIDLGICACHVFYSLISLNYNPKIELFIRNASVVFRIYPGSKVSGGLLFRRNIRKYKKTKKATQNPVATSQKNKLGYNDLRGALKTVLALYPTVNPAIFGVQVALRTATALCTKIDPKNKGILGLARTASIVYSKLDTKQKGFNKMLNTARALIPVFKQDGGT